MASVPLPLHLCMALMSLAIMEVQGVGDDLKDTWPHQKVPLVLEQRTVPLANPEFLGEEREDATVVCGIECQRELLEPGQSELEKFLSYETVYENGTRTFTEVSLQSLMWRNASTYWHTAHSNQSPVRRRRQVYGMDGRFVISDKHFITNYPFAASVRLSTGCSGILVSPKHVLTAAHCVHDGQDYLKGSKQLRVGVLKLRSKRSGVRRGRGSRRRDRKGGEEEGDEEMEDQGGKKRKGRRRKNRARRAVEPKEHPVTSQETKEPAFRWTRVKQTQVPKGWMQAVGQRAASDYDYALLELKRRPKVKYMDLGVVPVVKDLPAGRIHFSGFDDDQAGKVVYRFCTVTEESDHLMYQYCDAKKGSSGAGVYVRLREPEGKKGGKGKWKRKVIGVFSGHQSAGVNGVAQDYNVAVRITPLKYAQICHWIHGDPTQCQQS